MNIDPFDPRESLPPNYNNGSNYTKRTLDITKSEGFEEIMIKRYV